MASAHRTKVQTGLERMHLHTAALVEFIRNRTSGIASGAVFVASICNAPIVAVVLHECSSVERRWNERVLAAPHLHERGRAGAEVPESQ